jgi:hypothetical protein
MSQMPSVASLPAVASGASKASLGDGTFLRQVERNVALLGGQRFLRISLFRFEFVGIAAGEIGIRVRLALASLGMVGLLPDGSLGLLYVAPRPSVQEDLAVERSVADKVNRTLAVAAPSDARLLSVTAAHRWADEIGGADDLIDEVLFVSATQPRSSTAFRKAS